MKSKAKSKPKTKAKEPTLHNLAIAGFSCGSDARADFLKRTPFAQWPEEFQRNYDNILDQLWAAYQLGQAAALRDVDEKLKRRTAEILARGWKRRP